MSIQSSVRSGPRLLAAVVALGVVVVGLPALLVAVAARRFGHLSPVHGMNAPWRWSIDDLHSWANRLAAGVDSSAELVDLFFRVALVVGWVCVAVLVYSIVDELVFQIRHGMPSSRHRRIIGLGSLGRNLATVLVALLPLTANAAAPALAGSPTRAPAAAVQYRVASLDEPLASIPDAPVPPALAPPDPSSGWSVVEVQRGDSVWAIAARVANGRDVGVVARQIVAANIGNVMVDGHRFSTPALIEPGWLLSVPGPSAPVGLPPAAVSPPATLPDSPPPSGSYVVEPGDSYWDIAERHLDPSAAGRDIVAYTERLMAINAPLLGYADARLIRPGDVVQLADPLLPDVVASPETDAAIEPVPAIAPMPAPVVPDPIDVQVSSSTPLPRPEVPATVPSPAAPVSAAAAMAVHRADDNIAMVSGLAAAAVLAGGTIAALTARRRQQLRAAGVGARLLPPTEHAMQTETLLRSLSDADRLARLDLALRCAAPALADQQARPLVVEVSDEGEIRLYTDRPAMTVSPLWLLDIESGAWRLPAHVSLADLAADARRANQPCPAIIHIGTSAGGDLFVDLEAVGSLSIDAPPSVAASIVRCAAASLAVSPFAESSRVFTVGLETETQLGSPNVESLESMSDAIASLRTTVASIAEANRESVPTFSLRTEAHGGEAWEPSLLLTVGADDPAELAALVCLAGAGGRGIGVMIDRRVPGAGAVLRADDADFVLEPLGRRVSPVGLSVAEVSAVDDLLESADLPLTVAVDGLHWPAPGHSEFSPRASELIVHLLGQVAVQSADGLPVAFDRSKAQELVVWLSQHRQRPTRSSARTALWDLAVRDATFSNVVSDARRAMAKVTPPPAGQEWIGRTMSEDLPLHDLVVSDAELLAERVAAARGLGTAAAIAVLRPGVALIQGMPFAGTSYLWPDAEGITSSLVLMATTAAAELAALYLSIDDVDGVFWATGQGLKVLAGHEELIALRMRAHASRGDLAGVRSEWESYERAVHADSWSAAEPSPKLVALRRQLLAPSMVG